MRKSDILVAVIAVIAIILTALYYNVFVFFALIIFLPFIIWRIFNKKDTAKALGPRLLTIEEATAAYGDPDEVIIADATRANESAGCILVYKQKRILVIAGEPVSMDDIVDVSSVNTATPYTVGQYQVVLTTKRSDRQYIRLDVGMDNEYAKDVAMQVIDAMKNS